MSICQIDAHFTQYYTNGLYLNPALTGVINEGDISLTAIRRNQWSNVTNPYVTTGIAADLSTSKNWGFGINVMQQTAGNAGYKNTTAVLSISNNNIAFGFDNTQHISIAIQTGITNKRIDPSKFTFGDQYNPAIGYDPSISSSGQSLLSVNQFSQLETGAGLFYYETSEYSNVNTFGGVAIAHIFAQKNNFNNASIFLPLRLTLHGGARITLSEKFSWSPNFIYMNQGKSNEIVPGIQSEYNLSDAITFNSGINYRHLDAINAIVGLKINNFSIGFSYDISISGLNNFARNVNSTEFSLKYVSTRPHREKREVIRCPRL
jgi:type IX secretion system PorP/SprF family membrane protein